MKLDQLLEEDQRFEDEEAETPGTNLFALVMGTPPSFEDLRKQDEAKAPVVLSDPQEAPGVVPLGMDLMDGSLGVAG